MRKIVVVPDSFKGTLSSIDFCRVAKKALDGEVIAVPVADGGEGTVDCFLEMGWNPVSATVTGPLFESVEAVYAVRGDTAVLESATACGLDLSGGLVMKATTYGVGELIEHAVEVSGCKSIILGLGGSGTNDGGCGALCALGAKFYDSLGNSFVPVGGTLGLIADIDASELPDIDLTLMCDVSTTFLDAAVIFAPQKGADETEVLELTAGLMHLASFMPGIENVPGGGAAGGLGAGLHFFLKGKIVSGIDAILDAVDFENLISDADFVITGEGKLDESSVSGKVVSGVARRAAALNVPCIAVCGAAEIDGTALNLSAVHVISTKSKTLEELKKTIKDDLYAKLKEL
ncbi:MAG: glycerate kinase [Ruminococcaceae bacterium]|nr:glycerate kinase [Oscillospiraceae bacterium]